MTRRQAKTAAINYIDTMRDAHMTLLHFRYNSWGRRLCCGVGT